MLCGARLLSPPMYSGMFSLGLENMAFSMPVPCVLVGKNNLRGLCSRSDMPPYPNPHRQIACDWGADRGWTLDIPLRCL